MNQTKSKCYLFQNLELQLSRLFYYIEYYSVITEHFKLLFIKFANKNDILSELIAFHFSKFVFKEFNQNIKVLSRI